MHLISVKTPCILIAGGYNYKKDGIQSSLNSVEVISKCFKKAKSTLPKLPKEISKCKISTKCSMFIHDGALMVFGNTGNCCSDCKAPWKCFQFKNGTWSEHSTLNRNRSCAATVATDKGTFIFGGNLSRKSYEYLPIGSDKWKNGDGLHDNFIYGCAIEVKSKQEIWLIGGITRRILSFNINSQTSQELPFKLRYQREYAACAYTPGTSKIIVTGGITNCKHQKSCEIIDTESGTVTMASPMNRRRCSHGMGIIKFNGEERLAVFGGTQGLAGLHDSIELYNIKTDKWEMVKGLKLNGTRSGFGFVNI